MNTPAIRERKTRKTENEPTKRFMSNAFEAAMAAGFDKIKITTPYGVVLASKGDDDEQATGGFD